MRFFGQGVQQGATNLYHTRDHLGSVREVVDNTGAVRARYDYDPYGRRTKLSGDVDATFGFTGHFVHQETGLDLTLHRAYDPNVGRWLSRDPLGLIDGPNLYGYARQNPISLTDPYGGLAGGPTGLALGLAVLVALFVVVAVAINSTPRSPELDLDDTIKDLEEEERDRQDMNEWLEPSTQGAGRGGKVPGAYRGCSNPWGQPGKPDHQATVRYLRQLAQSEFPDAVISESKSIAGPTGLNRFPDVVAQDPWTGEVLKVYEAARTYPDGTFHDREMDKMAEYDKHGVPHHFEPVCPR